jgi:chromosome partitioning protein
MSTIIAVVNHKGGVGKTTLATNLAARRAHDVGTNAVKLIDTDLTNHNADDWLKLRAEVGTSPMIGRSTLTGRIYKDLLAEAPRWAAVIVDCPGSDCDETRGAMAAADVIVMPVQIGQFDTWSLGWMGRMISDMRAEGRDTPVLTVLNKVPPSCTREAADSMAMLREMGEYFTTHDTILWERQSVRSAARAGLGVHELQARGGRDEKAIAEMETVYQEVFRVR